jgi:hypothetical protein
MNKSSKILIILAIVILGLLGFVRSRFFADYILPGELSPTAPVAFFYVSGPDTARPGDTISYTVTLRIFKEINNVKITNEFPDGSLEIFELGTIDEANTIKTLNFTIPLSITAGSVLYNKVTLDYNHLNGKQMPPLSSTALTEVIE